jgi:hypothetical protein
LPNRCPNTPARSQILPIAYDSPFITHEIQLANYAEICPNNDGQGGWARSRIAQVQRVIGSSLDLLLRGRESEATRGIGG